MPLRERLLPPWAAWAGAVALAAGTGLAVARFGYGVKPSWLELPVFALSSAYFEARAFTVITKNLTDELTLLLTVGGLFALALSRASDETDASARLRLDSLLLALKLNVVLLAVALLTVFGVGFVGVLVANLYALPALFLLVFHVRRAKARRGATEAPC